MTFREKLVEACEVLWCLFLIVCMTILNPVNTYRVCQSMRAERRKDKIRRLSYHFISASFHMGGTIQGAVLMTAEVLEAAGFRVTVKYEPHRTQNGLALPINPFGGNINYLTFNGPDAAKAEAWISALKASMLFGDLAREIDFVATSIEAGKEQLPSIEKFTERETKCKK